MAADDDSDPSKQTRREFVGYTCPAVGLGLASAAGGASGRLGEYVRPPTRSTQSSGNGSVATDVLPYPENPFIVAAFGEKLFGGGAELTGSWESVEGRDGYQPTTLSEKIRTILGLHPDVMDYHLLPSFRDGEIPTPETTANELDFSLRTDTPGAAGFNYAVMDGAKVADPAEASRRYGAFMEANVWRYPDGTPLENPIGVLARQFDGREHVYDERGSIPSVFAPGTLDMLVHVTARRLNQGFSGFWADGGPGVFRKNGLDFSVWARSAFQDHLSSLSADRLAELGIEDADAFDVRSYLEERDLTPDESRDPREDAVFREYLLHHHLGIREFFQEYRRAVERRFPDLMEQGAIKLWNNQYMARPFSEPQSANVYVSDAFDVMNTELHPVVRNGEGFKYKLLRAIGRFSKPVTAKGNLVESGIGPPDALVADVDYRMLQRFQMAEAYANGARFKLVLTTPGVSVDEAIANWVRADGTVPEDLQSFVDFVWAHRRFLEGGEPRADCAVVWSLPTRLWRFEPQWGIGGHGRNPRLESFVGTTRLLREAQIPYDIVVFGHPRLWDDADQLDRLGGYDTVVLPGVECLSGGQATAIEEYLAAGGTVVTSGQPPARDEMFVPDHDLAESFERDGVSVLEGDPGYRRASDGRSDGSLIDVLGDAGVESVAPGVDPTLSVNLLTQPAEDRTIVHVLNYDYEPGADVFDAKEEVDLRLPAPEHEVAVARYYSPQQIVDLSVTSGADGIELTVPELVEWGFVVLASSPEDLVEAAAESSARQLVDEASRSVADARETDRDWGPEFALADTRLGAANTALEYEAYVRAEAAATEAIEAISETYPQPTIGIDRAHNQSTWEPPAWMGIDEDEPFWWLDESFDEYQFEVLDSWDRAALESIDVLLVPPTLPRHGSSFDFEPDELDRLEEFVSNGGSIVVVGDGRAADDVDELTDRFGYRFLGPRIQFPEGFWGMAPTTTAHPLTRGVEAISFANGTPIERWPDRADVLAAIPEDSPAWLSTQPPESERSEHEESAGGAPILAHGIHGEGHVVLLASPYFAFAPMHADPAMRLTANLLAYLGRESVRNRKDGAATPSTAGSTTTSDGQAGFSVVQSVVGVLAVIIVYLRGRQDDND